MPGVPSFEKISQDSEGSGAREEVAVQEELPRDVDIDQAELLRREREQTLEVPVVQVSEQEQEEPEEPEDFSRFLNEEQYPELNIRRPINIFSTLRKKSEGNWDLVLRDKYRVAVSPSGVPPVQGWSLGESRAGALQAYAKILTLVEGNPRATYDDIDEIMESCSREVREGKE